ncbi:hypothetical protein ANCCAN_20659 [Ancylostoma caninum]|uniref:Uncharacterized protein n=1 Tax=Ancylostoma caninum TaxID=29170 RepID=A0A368FN75_ANCCA|nr:hypothetical protein ANCCAN_20659 [Ancylostoma caninum]
MGPVKRSKTQPSEAMAVASTPVSTPDQVTAPLVGALANLDDASTVYGKEAKELRDAATEALVNVWPDARQSTSQLAQQFNQVLMGRFRKFKLFPVLVRTWRNFQFGCVASRTSLGCAAYP